MSKINKNNLNTINQISNDNLINYKDENLEKEIDKRIIPYFRNPVIQKEKTTLINTTYNLITETKNKNKNIEIENKNLKNKVITINEKLSLILKGFKIYNNNLNLYLINNTHLKLVDHLWEKRLNKYDFVKMKFNKELSLFLDYFNQFKLEFNTKHIKINPLQFLPANFNSFTKEENQNNNNNINNKLEINMNNKSYLNINKVNYNNTNNLTLNLDSILQPFKKDVYSYFDKKERKIKLIKNKINKLNYFLELINKGNTNIKNKFNPLDNTNIKNEIYPLDNIKNNKNENFNISDFIYNINNKLNNNNDINNNNFNNNIFNKNNNININPNKTNNKNKFKNNNNINLIKNNNNNQNINKKPGSVRTTSTSSVPTDQGKNNTIKTIKFKTFTATGSENLVYPLTTFKRDKHYISFDLFKNKDINININIIKKNLEKRKKELETKLIKIEKNMEIEILIYNILKKDKTIMKDNLNILFFGLNKSKKFRRFLNLILNKYKNNKIKFEIFNSKNKNRLIKNKKNRLIKQKLMLKELIFKGVKLLIILYYLIFTKKNLINKIKGGGQISKFINNLNYLKYSKININNIDKKPLNIKTINLNTNTNTISNNNINTNTILNNNTITNINTNTTNTNSNTFINTNNLNIKSKWNLYNYSTNYTLDSFLNFKQNKNTIENSLKKISNNTYFLKNKDSLIDKVYGSKVPVTISYYNNNNNNNNNSNIINIENKPILNLYLKELSIYNMRKKGIFIYYSLLTGYFFNKKSNKLYKNIYKLLAASFKSMYSLISKPVFIATPDKIIIQLFYFVFIPNILKLKKYYKLQHSWFNYNKFNKFKKRKIFYNTNKFRLNKKDYFRKKRKFKRQLSKFRKLKKNVRIKLRKLSNMAINKVFYNKLKILCLLLNKIFKKPVELDLIRLHYPYNDSNILVNLLGIMINKIKLRIIIRRFFQKSVIKNVNKFKNNKLKFIPAFLSGISIKVAGRLLTHKVVPRRTVKLNRKGATASGRINFRDVATFKGKNKRGAFSITVKSGQNLF